MVEREKTKQGQGSTKAAIQEATKQEFTTHRITTKKTTPQKRPFVIRSVALAADNEQTLENLKQTASDMLGQTVSSSAVIRAVLRYVAQQPSSWVAQQIHPLLEEEIDQGRVWGTKRKP